MIDDVLDQVRGSIMFDVSLDILSSHYFLFGLIDGLAIFMKFAIQQVCCDIPYDILAYISSVSYLADQSYDVPNRFGHCCLYGLLDTTNRMMYQIDVITSIYVDYWIRLYM